MPCLVSPLLPAGAVIGDSLAQWFTGLPYDILRNMRMSVYGLIVGGPSGHYWHQVSDVYLHACISLALLTLVASAIVFETAQIHALSMLMTNGRAGKSRTVYILTDPPA